MNKIFDQSVFKNTWFYLMPTFILCSYFIYISYFKPIGDFGNYYYASKFLWQGNWGLWIYDVATFNLKIFELGQRDFFLNYTPVPPFSAIFYIPFVGFKVEMAKVIWNILNLLLLLFAISRLKEKYALPVLFWVLFPILFFTPIRNNIKEGQSYFLILFLLAEGFIQFQKGNLGIMAILWALAIHLKISPAFVFLFLLFNKNFKAMFYLTIVGIVYVFISLPFLTISVWFNYVVSILPRLFNGEVNDTYALNYQSMQVLLKTLFVPDILSNKNAWFNQPMIYQKTLLVFKFIIVGLSVLCANSKISHHVKFGIWLLCSMQISGYGNSFSLLLLSLPTVYFLPIIPTFSAKYFIFLFLLVLTVNIPFYWFSHLFLPLQFPRLFAFISLFIISIVVAKIRYKWYYFIFPILVIFIPLKPQNYPQNYLFKQEEALLIYDFKMYKKHVLINYFDLKGPSIKLIPLDFITNKATYFEQPLNLNRLFSKNLEACQVNDSITIYLSDLNRGVGFYTLRTLVMNKESLVSHQVLLDK